MRDPKMNRLVGTGVDLRGINLLRRAVGSYLNPVLFNTIQNRLATALEEVFSANASEIQEAMTAIIEQIRSDLKTLKGIEINSSRDNSSFLLELTKVKDQVLGDMKDLTEVIKIVKVEAVRDGYL
jgi:hypothetical protein